MIKLFTCAFALCLLAAPALAEPYRDKIAPYYPHEAKSGLEQYKPLLVIRYNQNNVYYQLPLYNAVQKALQVKPTAQFTFLSKFPFTGQPEKDQQAEIEARANWQNVLQTITDIGLPERQFTVRFEPSNMVLSNEILLYVQ